MIHSVREYAFRALITFPKGGRMIQGWRSDFWYGTAGDGLWMIWPSFLDAAGVPLPDGSEVPNPCEALMYVVNDELRQSVHEKRIVVGLEFSLCEGRRIRARGKVLEPFSRVGPYLTSG